jgi:hypothetical protein
VPLTRTVRSDGGRKSVWRERIEYHRRKIEEERAARGEA